MKRDIYSRLLNWKEKNIKMPYMLVGARQTGKTYILKEFCENEFDDYVYINLEKQDAIKAIFEQTIDPDEIIRNIEIIIKRDINIERTIIFFDEIQVSERAITSLKYFCESEKPYKIICAGSLLGVKINRFKSSFPVGKVWIDYLYPMNFNEFLYAVGEEKLANLVVESFEKMTPLLDSIHQKALNLYKEYMCLGGMPAIIMQYIENNNKILSVTDENASMIITAYLADMAKYTENTESVKNIKIYQSIPSQLGKANKKFKYSLVDKSARNKYYETSLEWLKASNMIIYCQGIKTPQSPLIANKEDIFKIYMSDIGLLRVLANIDKSEILLDKNMIYKGVLAENYVAQILSEKYRELYYWQLGSEYEVDFVANIRWRYYSN